MPLGIEIIENTKTNAGHPRKVIRNYTGGATKKIYTNTL